MPVPIFSSHDHTKIVGTIRPYGGGTRFLVQFPKDQGLKTIEEFNEVFGNCGAHITGWHEQPSGVRVITTAEIVCFSLSRAGAARAAAPLVAILER